MDSKLLKVYDNLVPTPLQNYLEEYITNHAKDNDGGFPLYYTDTLTSESSKDIDIGFSNLFYENDVIVTRPMALLLSPLYALTLSQNIRLIEITLGRVFLQIPSLSFGPQKPHKDISEPHLVCLYYVNDSDGDTIFFDDNNDEIKRISPKKGRIAFFDGSILHCGTPSDTRSRAVINFNFTGEKLGEEK